MADQIKDQVNIIFKFKSNKSKNVSVHRNARKTLNWQVLIELFRSKNKPWRGM